MKIRLTLAVVLTLILTGCGSGVRFVPTDDTIYTPKPKDAPVALYERGCMEPHVVMGVLSTQKKMKASFNDKSVYDEALAALKAEARKLGADALMQVSPRVMGEGMGSKVEIQATAIRYLNPAGSVSSTEVVPGS